MPISTTPEAPLLSRLEYVEAQVMQLTITERNHLLEHLINSLDTDPEVEAAWDKVADEREADIASGRSHWIPYEEAMAGLREHLASLTKAG